VRIDHAPKLDLPIVPLVTPIRYRLHQPVVPDVAAGIGLVRRLSNDDILGDRLECGCRVASKPGLVRSTHNVYVPPRHRPPSIPRRRMGTSRVLVPE
jgi:hypothetical protein